MVFCGAGGHLSSVLSSAKILNKFEIVGYCDINDKNRSDLTYLGNDECLLDLKNKGIENAFVSIGSVGDSSIRENVYAKINSLGFISPSIIDKSAIVDTTNIGKNVFIGKSAVVNANAQIGNMAIINTGSIIEHDTKIGDFVHIAPNSTICGGAVVGSFSHIGAGSTIIQNITIGKNCIIGAGSVVVKDIPDNSVAYGNPCRVVRKNEK